MVNVIKYLSKAAGVGENAWWGVVDNSDAIRDQNSHFSPQLPYQPCHCPGRHTWRQSALHVARTTSIHRTPREQRKLHRPDSDTQLNADLHSQALRWTQT